MLILLILSAVDHNPATKDDARFARELCQRNPDSLTRFLGEFTDPLYYIAARFNNRGIKRDGWFYQTDNGRILRVTDDVADTVLWLLDQALVKSCHYRGESTATFRTYILAVLNSHFTFKDWLKWKTGVTAHVPIAVRQLGKEYESLFRLLKQKRTLQFISARLQMDENDIELMQSRIETVLSESGQSNLLWTISVQSLDPDAGDEHGSQEPADPAPVDDATRLDAKAIQDFLRLLLEKLDIPDRRLLLLYWRENLSAEDIYRQFSRGLFADYGQQLGLSSPTGIYDAIDRVCRRALQTARKLKPTQSADWSLSARKLRKLLRIFLENRLEDKS